MKIINPAIDSSLLQTRFNSRNLNSEQERKDKSQPVDNQAEAPFRLRSPGAGRVRVIKVAEEGVEVSELAQRAQQSASRSPASGPASQYQSTQDILRKEELAQAFSVDLFV